MIKTIPLYFLRIYVWKMRFYLIKLVIYVTMLYNTIQAVSKIISPMYLCFEHLEKFKVSLHMHVSTVLALPEQETFKYVGEIYRSKHSYKWDKRVGIPIIHISNLTVFTLPQLPNFQSPIFILKKKCINYLRKTYNLSLL